MVAAATGAGTSIAATGAAGASGAAGGFRHGRRVSMILTPGAGTRDRASNAPHDGHASRP